MTYCEKKKSGDREKLLNDFEITRTVYSKCERSEQVLATECFLTCSWRFLIHDKLEQLEFKFWDLET